MYDLNSIVFLREHISEEELEQKFTSLALAFTIDAATIKDRCERQKRSRDQTETNLNMEIEKLRERLTLMQPLCTDYEKAELFSTIVTQVFSLKLHFYSINNIYLCIKRGKYYFSFPLELHK